MKDMTPLDVSTIASSSRPPDDERAKGYTYKEIGEKLFISTKAVQNTSRTS